MMAASLSSFNTQPPEGGWIWRRQPSRNLRSFNTQPPEGGWLCWSRSDTRRNVVSTHSRLKAAGRTPPNLPTHLRSFNTQPPEGGWRVNLLATFRVACFNTQPPEGGWAGAKVPDFVQELGFNTQPPEGGWKFSPFTTGAESRFNTQPPEGGWLCLASKLCLLG